MKRIAIDMDEVITDSVGRYIEWYAQEHGRALRREELQGKSVPDVVEEAHRTEVARYPHRIGFFKNLALMPGAKEVIDRLFEKYEIFIVTAAMEFPNSLPEKLEWLNEHFPFLHWKQFVFLWKKKHCT
ncbi:MAG: 5'(3')-deoxyribonucleotidase, partial [Bacteroidia bacterium]|nr:5'(3')-deoxyribonucleotidase [Bacteroidia bacterium]